MKWTGLEGAEMTRFFNEVLDFLREEMLDGGAPCFVILFLVRGANSLCDPMADSVAS